MGEKKHRFKPNPIGHMTGHEAAMAVLDATAVAAERMLDVMLAANTIPAAAA